MVRFFISFAPVYPGLFYFKGIEMARSETLQKARSLKNDEFYTQMCDIEKECSNYLGHFFDKVIYCNCDTAESNFVKYFLGLKQAGKICDVIWSGGLDGMDFRSPESIEMLKKADVVVSNPPFSLFREYISQLIEHNKKFLIIGNQNAVAYREVFPLIMSNRMWLGTRRFSQDMFFDIPNPQDFLAKGKSRSYSVVNGIVKARTTSTWFTNLEHNKPRGLKSVQKEYDDNYQKYDNADAINIDKVADIPNDYYGTMGVPLSFIDKYNPKQFELLGLGKDFTFDGKGLIVNGKYLYHRIFIKKQSNTAVNDNNTLTEKAA